MKYDVAITGSANAVATDHLLQHYRNGVRQEDLCFALWRPSTGHLRRTALIDEILLPKDGERILHGNVSFTPEYAGRAIQQAHERKAGLAFMHSHRREGWQDLSDPDAVAERDVLAYPANSTGLPLVGLTVGGDGYWSARFWEKHKRAVNGQWCEKVRVTGPKSYALHFNDNLLRPSPRRDVLMRTYDSWGTETQNALSRMRVGIVGLGSVGCIVAEAMARIGVRQMALFDPDCVQRHNLDRLLYGTVRDIGKLKVDLAKAKMERSATAENVHVVAIPRSIHAADAYREALDCDILLSCVDRPVARDVLNYIANAHLIPVIDCGIAIEKIPGQDRLALAHWRAHVVTPYHQCLRCNKQYNTSMVTAELDGSLDNPSYVNTMPDETRIGNENVFPFSLAAAGMAVNLMLRYLMSPDWWPAVQQQDYHFHTGQTRIINEQCLAHCPFRNRRAMGDWVKPSFIR